MKKSSQLKYRYPNLLRVFLHSKRKLIPATVFSGNKATLFSSLSLVTRLEVHEAMVSDYLKAKANKTERDKVRKRAARFFAHALVSLEPAEPTTHLIEELSLHIMEQSTELHDLQLTFKQKQDELLLTQSHQIHYEELLKKSETHKDQLRRLSRQLLTAQEDERRKISRELHDVIAQTLTGINIKLATLKKLSTSDLKKLLRSISSTQRLVKKSVALIHQFACELRPSIIDILGLTPALESLAHQFSTQTGIKTGVKSTIALVRLNSTQRTCLFRVAEEALTNVARHSEANQVSIILSKEKSMVSMSIHDNGKSFCVLSASRNQDGSHLGLLGMRERVEMLHGTFLIESSPDQGTKITASIPIASPGKRKTKPIQPP